MSAALKATAPTSASRVRGPDVLWTLDAPRRTPRAQKRVRAQQAELYVQALGLKGACKAMGLGPWQIHSLRRWLRGGQPVPHNRGNHVKSKLSAQDRADILAMKGREKSAYPAALYKVHPSTVRRIWNGWEPRA